MYLQLHHKLFIWRKHRHQFLQNFFSPSHYTHTLRRKVLMGLHFSDAMVFERFIEVVVDLLKIISIITAISNPFLVSHSRCSNYIHQQIQW